MRKNTKYSYTSRSHSAKFASHEVKDESSASVPVKVNRVAFLGDSREVLRSFPKGAKSDLGYSLFQLEIGQLPPDSKPMPGLPPGVFELCEQDEAAWYRVIYYTKIKGVIYVLHCFEKQTNKTEKRDLDTASLRLKQLQKVLRE